MTSRDPQPDDEYDLAPAAKHTPPPPPRQSEGEPQLRAAKPVLAYRTPPGAASVGSAKARADPETIKNFYMPLWLLSVGLVIEVVAAFFRERRIEQAFAYVGINVIVGTVLMLGGMLLAAKFRGIDLGQFWTAVFKLSAIVVAPAALFSLFAPFLRFIPFGLVILWIGSFVLYFALIGALFDLDESDTWFCVCVIFLIRLGLYFLLLWLALR